VRNYDTNQVLFNTGAKLYSQLGSINTQDTRGKSDYHALQLQYEHRLSRGLTVTGAFTWSKTLDDGFGNLDAGGGNVPQLYTDYGIERGLSNQDVDYVLSSSALYELPFGRGKRWGSDVSKWMDYIVGGWQINAIYSLQGGTPFSITASGTPNTSRADLVGKVHVNPGNLQNYVDASAFTAPAKVQAYNLTNTPHFSNPSDTNLNDGKIGQINSVLTNSWRQVELALRFTF
jgi:hypothetical protein